MPGRAKNIAGAAATIASPRTEVNIEPVAESRAAPVSAGNGVAPAQSSPSPIRRRVGAALRQVPAAVAREQVNIEPVPDGRARSTFLR